QGEPLDRVLAKLCQAVADSAPTVPEAEGLATNPPRRLLPSTLRGEASAPGPDHGTTPPPTPPGGLESSQGTDYYRAVASIGLQVADALAHAHSQGVL